MGTGILGGYQPCEVVEAVLHGFILPKLELQAVLGFGKAPVPIQIRASVGRDAKKVVAHPGAVGRPPAAFQR